MITTINTKLLIIPYCFILRRNKIIIKRSKEQILKQAGVVPSVLKLNLWCTKG